jgi:putative N6-adenine-specific DNA methylase
MASADRRTRQENQPRQTAVYQYQQDNRYFAQVAEGLKDAGAQELADLGAGDIQPDFSGIHFKADKPTLYRINYSSRYLSRCLAPLVSYACPNTDTLYRNAKTINWENFIEMGDTFAVSGNVSDSAISHSKYAALRLKDAIADYFKEKTGRRPNVSARNPDLLLNLHIRNDAAVISLDTSGGALHKRGYREESVSAPMQETIAAAIIRFTEWDVTVPLYDPLCGSGTLLCEALMQYCHIPAGIFRQRFGFEYLPDFDGSVWNRVKRKADEKIRELPKKLLAGSDVSLEAVKAAQTNLMGLPFGNRVTIERVDFQKLPVFKQHVIVTNPPYGIRMGKDRNLDVFYKNFGDFLKRKCKGSSAFIYFGNRKYIKKIGLKASWKKPIKAGGLDGRLVKYEMY